MQKLTLEISPEQAGAIQYEVCPIIFISGPTAAVL